MRYRFLFEASPTPIYQRIIRALAAALEDKGHEVCLFRPRKGRPQDLVRQINNLKADVCFITNPHCLLAQYYERQQKFVYEMTKAHLVFIHHDNFFGPVFDSADIRRRFEGFQRTAGRSSHCCIERSNVDDLISLSVPNAFKIYHASEFKGKSGVGGYRYNVSFVGHVLPDDGFKEQLDMTLPLHRKAAHDFDERSVNFAYRIGDGAVRYADGVLPGNASVLDRLVAKQSYVGFVHNASLYVRGRLLFLLANQTQLDVVGGDPSYLHGRNDSRIIKSENITYNTPTGDYRDTCNIYTKSRINLNITPLQFDTALTNRVMDVGAAGGFLLTDYRDDLGAISVSEQISYRSADELKDKVDDYLSNDRKREEVAAQLQRDVYEKFTYERLIEFILGKVLPRL